MNQQKAIICNIDGTLANIDHRRLFVDYRYLTEKFNIENDYESSPKYKGHLPIKIVKENGSIWKPDWKRFNEEMINDTPNLWCIELIDGMIERKFETIYVSGREELYRQVTTSQIDSWIDCYELQYPPLERVVEYYKSKLFMRPTGDYRPDTEIKKEIYKQHIKDKYDVLFVLDDRPKVCQMWRELGLVCLQVDDKEF